MEAVIKIQHEHPDWYTDIHIGGKRAESGFFASLAEAIIHVYNILTEAFDIPFTFDGCPEHHPRIRGRNSVG